jgi:uncharacterized membrane protein (UPF0127 family)
MSRPLLNARNLDRETVIADRLENAGSFWAKFMGLMGRPSLKPGDGLWLPGENAIHMLFMRFAIDVLFLSPPLHNEGTGPTSTVHRVVSMRRALPRWRGVVWHASGAKGVVELPVGTIEASRTAIGDRIAIERTTSPTAGQ